MVRGASRPVLGGVFGIIVILGRSGFLEPEFLIFAFAGCGTTAADSDNREPFREFTLFRFSPVPNSPPKVFPLPEDLTEARSGLEDGLPSAFRDPVANTFLILAPGEIPRRFFEAICPGALRDCSLCCESTVDACRGARSDNSVDVLCSMGNVVDFKADEDLVEKPSARVEISGSVTLEVLISGDEDVI